MKKNAITLSFLILTFPLILFSQVETIHRVDRVERVDMAHVTLARGIEGKVQFRTLTGFYLSAENGGGGPIHAKATEAGDFELFSLEDMNAGAMSSGDQVKIRTSNGKLIFADANGAVSSIYFLTKGIEVFTIEKAIGSGPLQFGDAVCLKSSSGKYLSAIDGGGGEVTATAAWPHFTEVFILTAPESQEPTGEQTAFVKREILESGNVRLFYQDGTIKELFQGGMTITPPDGPPQTILYSSAQPPDIPPDPESAESDWLEYHAEQLLSFINELVGYDEDSINAYLDTETGLGIYEKISKRTFTIGFLLSP